MLCRVNTRTYVIISIQISTDKIETHPLQKYLLMQKSRTIHYRILIERNVNIKALTTQNTNCGISHVAVTV